MNKNKIPHDTNDIGLFINNLKREDKNYGNLSRRLQIFYIIMMLVYSIIAVIHYFESEQIVDLISGLCLPIAFLIFVFVFGKFQKEFRYVDYSVSTISMLKNAVKRYKPFQLKNTWVFVAILVVNFGFSMKISDSDSLLEFQIIFWGVTIVAILIGLLIWRIKYKALYDNALALIKEIEA